MKYLGKSFTVAGGSNAYRDNWERTFRGETAPASPAEVPDEHANRDGEDEKASPAERNTLEQAKP